MLSRKQIIKEIVNSLNGKMWMGSPPHLCGAQELIDKNNEWSYVRDCLGGPITKEEVRGAFIKRYGKRLVDAPIKLQLWEHHLTQLTQLQIQIFQYWSKIMKELA